MNNSVQRLSPHDILESAANEANFLFETWLRENSKVVFSDGKLKLWSSELDILGHNPDTHQALLVCIEPIEKKKCEKHEPDPLHAKEGLPISYCVNCGTKLRPVYEECE